jgi:hypothetical protein
MASTENSMRRVARESLKVAPSGESQDWISATVRLPAVGESVCCTDGMAEVTRVLGKTGDGSRLLELTLPDRPKHPFFAAASNVLVQPG